MSSRRTLYVGNLPGDVREREVEDLFYKYGPIAHIELKIPPRPLGYAFVEGSYESQEDSRITLGKLMRFAYYFGSAFSSVGSAQFPWMKMLKESSIAKMVDIPLSNIPEAVYKTSMDWLNRRSLDALGSLVLSLWDGILADLATHQGSVKGAKKVAPQQPSSKSQAFEPPLDMSLRADVCDDQHPGAGP